MPKAAWYCNSSNTLYTQQWWGRTLSSVLGPSLQERHWGPEACPENANETGEDSLQGMAEGAEIVQSQEEEAQG